VTETHVPDTDYEAAGAVFAALALPAGTYDVVDDEPLVRSVYFGLLAQELGVPPPKLQPASMMRVFGSLGELLARSQRISNRRLRKATGWAPAYPSMREGWRAVLDAREPREMA
jgi:nucleoside-diphosphate-sugar epimerase